MRPLHHASSRLVPRALRRLVARRRGFALLVVMVLSVAMVVVAAALTLSSGLHAVAAAHDGSAELARVVAESGLARADAWAIQALKTSGGSDFDRVLDPSLDANCSGLDAAAFNLSAGGAAPAAGASTFLPAFTEGAASVVEFPAGSGRRWRRVALDKGAYLVRYEDNADDGITPAGDWGARTGNNPGPSGCVEGPAQGENPARDRDGAIWAQVMGIYPGTNPVTAVHRVLLRKLIRLPAVGSAFSVGGNVGENIKGDNAVGTMVVGGNLASAEGFCGKVSVGGTSTATANPTCSPTPNPLVHEPGAAVSPRVVPDPKDGAWYDWTTPCNFYVQPGVGLFFWDSAARRGDALCSSYTGPMVPPNPDVSQPPGSGSCWTPVILRGDPCTGAPCTSTNNIAFPYEPFENGTRDWVRHTGAGLAPTCAAFKPGPAPVVTYVDPGTGYAPGGYSATASSIGVGFRSWFTPSTESAARRTVTIPDFQRCSVAGSPSELRWPTSAITASTPMLAAQPTTFPRMACTTCDAATPSLQICPAESDRAVQFLDNFGAYVTGVVYKEGSFSAQPGFSGTEPTGVLGARTVWPMFTFIVEQNFVLDVNDKLWFGVGTKKGPAGFGFPSLVIGGNLDGVDATGTASLKVLGGLYVRGNVTMKKALTMYGPVAVNGNVEGLSGGDTVWDYDYDFFGSAAPEPIVTFPVAF
jgi:hypothetical protein